MTVPKIKEDQELIAIEAMNERQVLISLKAMKGMIIKIGTTIVGIIEIREITRTIGKLKKGNEPIEIEGTIDTIHETIVLRKNIGMIEVIETKPTQQVKEDEVYFLLHMFEYLQNAI